MALLKDKTLDNGAAGNYWRIVDTSINFPSHTVTYIITLFFDQAHSAAHTPSLGLYKKYVFQGLTSEQLNGDLRSFGYDSIKTKAATMVLPLGGSPGDDLVIYDPDLNGATDA